MTDKTVTDAELVRKAQRGDSIAFDELVDRHYQRVFNLSFRILGNVDDAADATQTAFIKAFEQLKSFRGEASFTTWLYRIVTNACHDLSRKRKAVTFSDLSDEDHSDLDPIWLTDPNYNELWEQREQSELVRMVLNQLPEESRQVLAVCDMEGLSYAEASAVLNIPEGTLKSRLHRARNAFKKAWLEFQNEQNLSVKPSKKRR